MIEQGLIERFPCDAVFAMHHRTGVPQGHLVFREHAAMAWSNAVTITLTGTGGQGAMPHLAADPVGAAARVVMALQTVLSRNIDPQQTAIVTVGAIHPGKANNVIPQTATLALSARALDAGVRDLLQAGITARVQAQAASFGVRAVVDYPRAYPVLVNSPAKTTFAHQVAVELLGAGNGTLQGPALTGSGDFAVVLQHAPAAACRSATAPAMDPVDMAAWSTTPAATSTATTSPSAPPPGCCWRNRSSVPDPAAQP